MDSTMNPEDMSEFGGSCAQAHVKKDVPKSISLEHD
jgi:hypothetical protein